MNSPDKITQLEKHQVFVYGANRAGCHGAGAALFAKQRGWANQRTYSMIDVGPKGMSFGIPTKDENLNVLSLDEIKREVDCFINYALVNRELEFLVTAVGCGLSGYKPEDIAPMFRWAPRNVLLPKVFTDALHDLGIRGSIDRFAKVVPDAQGTEARVIQDIINRQQAGIKKYGTTVEQNPLNLRQWLGHAYEETLDQAIYLKRAMEEMDK